MRISDCSSDVFFFFKQKTAYEMRISDWSSDVCSSDLLHVVGHHAGGRARRRLVRERRKPLPRGICVRRQAAGRAQRSSRGSLSGLPSHSFASGGASLRAVITGQSFPSSAFSATNGSRSEERREGERACH